MELLEAMVGALRPSTIRPTSSDFLTEEDEADADPAADRALVECAMAARLHPWMYTDSELRILFGCSSVDPSKLPEPFDTLTPYMVSAMLGAAGPVHGAAVHPLYIFH